MGAGEEAQGVEADMKIVIDGDPYRVWFEHHPELQRGHGDQSVTTRAVIAAEVENSSWSVSGWAMCSPKDVYSRRKGRKVALARALKIGGFTKPQRAQAWKQLFEKGMKP